MWVKVTHSSTRTKVLVNLDRVESIGPVMAQIPNGPQTTLYYPTRADGESDFCHIMESLEDLELLIMQAPCKPSTS